MRTGIVYVLVDSRAPHDYRYVGKTTETLAGRLYRHRRSDRKHHAGNWIRSVYRAGARVNAVIIDTAPEDSLSFLECQWIAALREAGYRLTNSTDGGEGATGYRHTPEALALMSILSSARVPTEETKQRTRESTRARAYRHSDEMRAVMSARKQAGWNKRRGILQVVWIDLTCDDCGKEIRRRSDYAKPFNYCSRPCAGRGRAKQLNEKRLAKLLPSGP